MWLVLLGYLFYFSGLQCNPQYLWGIPIFSMRKFQNLFFILILIFSYLNWFLLNSLVIKFLILLLKVLRDAIFHILSHFQTLVRRIKDPWVSLVWPLLTDTSTRDSWTFTGKSGSVSCGDTALFSWVLVHAKFCFQKELLKWISFLS